MAYIDRDKAVSYFENHRRIGLHKDDIVAYLSSLPTADVEEVKHGYWREVNQTGKNSRHIKYTTKICSICGYCNGRRKTKRCPDCGAKMDGGKEE